MKKTKLRTLLLAVLLAVGTTLTANAQSAVFHHSEFKGRNYNGNEQNVSFSSLTSNYNSDWYKWSATDNVTVTAIGNTVTLKSGESPWLMCIQRYNHGNWAGEGMEWFYITYSAPSYSYVTYNLGVGSGDLLLDI